MVDWVSFGLAITALVMSTLTALVGLILTWINHQREYDPMIILGLFEKEKDTSKGVYIRNTGRGTAFNIQIDIYDEKKVMHRTIPINSLSPNELELIPGDITSFPDKTHTDMMELAHKNESLLFHFKFENDFGRKKHTYFLGEHSFFYIRLTRRKFRMYKNKNS